MELTRDEGRWARDKGRILKKMKENSWISV
jgi:hypothetical protein